MRQLAFALILMPWSLCAGDVEEIRVSGIDRVICLRADGTAHLSYRGQTNWFVDDERVGEFNAILSSRTFQRLAAMPGAVGFENLAGHYLPYSTSITRTTVIWDGKERTLERHDRGIDTDPEAPKELWALEMAVRGIALELKWEPIASGLIVNLGPDKKSRLVMVREVGSNYVVAAIRSSKDQVQIPVAPANYIVEVTTIIDERSVDLWHVPCAIAGDSYLSISEEDSYDTLTICTPNGWWLRVEDDGSGTIGHGPTFRESADFKRGTIHISKVMHDLGKLQKNDEMLGYRFQVYRRTKGDRPDPYYTKDSDTILPLFTKAASQNQTTRRGEEFDHFWTSQPPKLGEPVSEPKSAKTE